MCGVIIFIIKMTNVNDKKRHTTTNNKNTWGEGEEKEVKKKHTRGLRNFFCSLTTQKSKQKQQQIIK